MLLVLFELRNGGTKKAQAKSPQVGKYLYQLLSPEVSASIFQIK